MDTFILAATSFTIAVSLMIKGKKDALQTSFAGLCAAVFLSQISITMGNFFNLELLLKSRYIGLLAIAPSSLLFFRYLTRNKTLISRRLFYFFASASLCGVMMVFTPLAEKNYFADVVRLYTFFSLFLCYIALTWHVHHLASGTEKRRLFYLLVACPVAWVAGNAHLLNHAGLSVPVINGMVMSILLYFILLIIAYPQLRELHDFFARSLVIVVSTLTGAVIFYGAAAFFGGTPPSLTGLLLASFLVAISFSPMKMILKKIFSYFYPESKDVFTSLYEFDEKLEREKALMLAEMAPVMAHEIRNPLGSIKGAAQYLKSETSTREQQELLDVIVDGTDRLNAVVSQFLEYARPYHLNCKIQDMNTIIRKAVSVIAANHLAENIKIILHLEESLPKANVDDNQLVQVILNIALNAIESMPEGGTLTVSTRRQEADEEGDVSVMIRDTGAGISTRDLKDIFKPFFTTRERGVGLGLAICQKIIREHGGSIRVQSAVSQGTTFIIKLKSCEWI